MSPCEHPDRLGGVTPPTENNFINYCVLVVKIKITGNSTLLEESTISRWVIHLSLCSGFFWRCKIMLHKEKIYTCIYRCALHFIYVHHYDDDVLFTSKMIK